MDMLQSITGSASTGELSLFILWGSVCLLRGGGRALQSSGQAGSRHVEGKGDFGVGSWENKTKGCSNFLVLSSSNPPTPASLTIFVKKVALPW